MNYFEAIEFLYSLRLSGTKLGLDNPGKLAAMAGNPQDRLRFIHVAGTNGKGSTCAMLESIYRQAGYRVGLFTSPHLVRFNERIQVNRTPIPEAEVVRLVEGVQPLLESFEPDQRPTFFEVVTVMALLFFKAANCDLVVWETGLGGRLDATNIVRPSAAVITNVQFDHQKWLGSSLAEIAREKAGIIKPGVPTVTAADEAEALRVIQEIAKAQGAPLEIVTPAAAEQPPMASLRLRLLGRHQRLNAALATQTVRVLGTVFPVATEAMAVGLEEAEWPGRLQVVRRPESTIILDGAHNLHSVRALRDALEEHFPGARAAFVMGFLQDKDWAAMCRELTPLARAIYLAPVHSERAIPLETLKAHCQALNPTIPTRLYASLSAALSASSHEPFRVISGSLHFIGEAMEELDLTYGTGSMERRLNDWGALNPDRPLGR